MRAWLTRFMAGRYGIDDLGRFLNIAVIVLLVVSIFVPYISFLGMGLLIYQYFRVLSRNIGQRAAENEAYLRQKRRVTGWFAVQKKCFAQRKTHHFYKCPSCKQLISIPRGVGKVTVTCPSCRHQFSKKS